MDNYSLRSKRLKLIAEFILKDGIICDVGCDHAYLPIFLVSSGRVKRAIAMDVNQGPLDIAKDNKIKAGLSDRIDIRQSDGLWALEYGEADQIVIAGMGGALTLRILEKDMDKALSAKRWILQPQSELSMVRGWLREKCISIIDEAMLIERGKNYTVILADAANSAGLSEAVAEDQAIEDRFGPILLQKKDHVLIQFLGNEYKRLSRLVEQMPPEHEDRKHELYNELLLVKKALIRMGQQV